MAAFRAALEIGAGIECDLRLSRDGFPMVVHDGDLQRLCGVSVAAESLHAAQLSTLPLLGTDQAIPWLGDLIHLVNGQVPLLLELKRSSLPRQPTIHLCRAVAGALARYTGAVGVMSFDPSVAAWFGRHAPQLPRGLILTGRERWWARAFAIARADPTFVAVGMGGVAQPWLRRLRSEGMPLFCWTIRTLEDRAAATARVDGLIWEADGRP